MGQDEDKKINAMEELNRISGSSVVSNGDIIINNGNTKSNKKIIIFIVFAVIVMAIFLIAGIFISKELSKPKLDPALIMNRKDTESIENDMKKYLGLLQKGGVDEKYEKDMAIDAWYTVAIGDASEEYAEKAYLHALRLDEQTDSIIGAFSGLPDNNTKNRLLPGLIKSRDVLTIAGEYLKSNYIYTVVKDEYISNGYDAAKNKLNEYNNAFKKNDDKTIDEWRKKIINIRNMYLEVLSIIEANGCMAFGYIDNGCVDAMNNNVEIANSYNNIVNKMNDGTEELRKYSQGILIGLCRTAKNMELLIGGENE